MVFGIRCNKEKMYITILEGNIDNFIFSNDENETLRVSIPKSFDTREEQLQHMFKEITQVIDKYHPTAIGIKGHENSSHKINPTSNAQRGEIEGLIRLASAQRNIVVKTFLYSQTKKIIGSEKASKKLQLDIVRSKTGYTVKDDLYIDSILVAMAVL